MVCKECKQCWNYNVGDNDCPGSSSPCSYQITREPKHRADIVYCLNVSCPFDDCKWHVKQLPITEGTQTFANLHHVCRRYILWVYKRLMEE